MLAIVVGILQDHDAISQFGFIRPATIGIILRYPQATSIVKVQTDRLLNVWISREQSRIEPLRQLDQFDHFSGGWRMLSLGFRVEYSWKITLPTNRSWQNKSQNTYADYV
jgi:hypothetical protein